MRVLAFAILGSLTTVACGSRIDEPLELEGVRVQPRTASVIVEGCALDAWQRQTLSSPSARAVLREVVLLCPAFGATGSVVPASDEAVAGLRAELAGLRAGGYRVSLAFRAADERGASLSAAATASVLAAPDARAKVIAGLSRLSDGADALDVAIFDLPTEARADLVRFVDELGAAVRPTRALGLFAPPSIAEPSDLPGGDAFDLRALRVDRVRLMTLDYSCCGAPAGPTTDPGWMVDAARLARTKTEASLDVAYPLYGYDFFADRARAVTFLEARGLAAASGAPLRRGPTHALEFTWTDAQGVSHHTWFDDAVSTTRALAGLGADVLPVDVGVVFYGLGAEDPALFPALARAMR